MPEPRPSLPLAVAVDPTAPPGDVLKPLAKLLRRLRDRGDAEDGQLVAGTIPDKPE
jgi:hypothetical protein